MRSGEGADSQVVTRGPHHTRRLEIQALGLPTEITGSEVRVTLETGEYEVLVTSLTDEEAWPTVEFKQIYWEQRGTEGFYDILKTRLNLENFTGQTAESIYQDFYATVYLTGLESILTALTFAMFAEKTVHHPQQVNRAVSLL